MGFFSSRKAEIHDSYMDGTEKSVVQSIRSRLVRVPVDRVEPFADISLSTANPKERNAK